MSNDEKRPPENPVPTVPGEPEEKTDAEKELEKKLEDKDTELTKKTTDMEAVTGELITMRKDLAEAKKQIPPQAPPTEVDTKIDERFKIENERRAETNRVLAWNEFIKKNPEFNPDNDTTGLRKAILDEKLIRLVTEGHYSKEEILADFSEALTLMTEKKEVGTPVFPSGSSPAEAGGEPGAGKPKDEIKFTKTDLEFIHGMGLNPDKVAERIRKRRGV